jgi:isopenicillin-N N-acyltransferase like protein
MTYPRIRVSGGPRERGRQYGEAAREQVRRSVEAYEGAFAHYAGWDWETVRAEAARFVEPIAAFDPRYADELEGIAEGARVDLLDVVAINVRTEVMFAASARAADAGPDGNGRPPLECSSFAALPSRTGGATLAGQTWDWLAHAFETVVVLEAEQDDGPNFVTVVEGGLLAKAGMNAAGIALMTNALVCDRDAGDPGVPYHVLLRGILDAETAPDALAAMQRGSRSSSANYLVAHADGIALDVEAAPGDYSRLFVNYPEDDLLLHTNHFRHPGFDARDVAPTVMQDSPFRLARVKQLTETHDGPLDRAFWESALADHVLFPASVCCHVDARAQSDPERYATVMAVIADPAERVLWLASGNPCEAPFERLDYAELLAARNVAVA